MGSVGIPVGRFLAGRIPQRCPAIGTKAEGWPGSCHGWKGSWDRLKRFTQRNAQLIGESNLFRWRSGLLIRPMEREGWRRYVGDIYRWHGRQRQIPDYSRRVIRRMECKWTQRPVSFVRSSKIAAGVAVHSKSEVTRRYDAKIVSLLALRLHSAGVS